jgi:hypothetical protein
MTGAAGWVLVVALAAPDLSPPLPMPTSAPRPAIAGSLAFAGWNGAGFQYAWWAADPYGTHNVPVWLNRLSLSGALLDSTGVQIGGVTSDERPYVVCSASSCMVLFDDVIDSAYGVLVTGGAPSAAVGPVAMGNGFATAVAWDGAHYVALYADSAALHAVRFDATGTVLDGANGLALPNSATAMDAVADCFNGRCLAVWNTGPPANDLRGARFASGATLDTNNFIVATSGLDELKPAITDDGQQWYVAWSRADGGFATPRYGRVAADGGVLDGPNGVPLEAQSVTFNQAPCIAFDGARVMVGWARSGQLVMAPTSTGLPVVLPQLGAGPLDSAVSCASGPGVVFVSHIEGGTPCGELLFNDGGVVGPVALAPASSAQSSVSIAGYDGGFKVIWVENDPLQGGLHGVDFGPGGFSAAKQLWPAFSDGARLACGVADCFVTSIGGFDGGLTDDGIAYAVVHGPGLPSAMTFLPDVSPPIIRLAVARSSADWLVVTVDNGFGSISAATVSNAGAIVNPGFMLFNSATEYPEIIAAHGASQTWLGYLSINTNNNRLGHIAAFALDDPTGLPVDQGWGSDQPLALAESSAGLVVADLAGLDQFDTSLTLLHQWPSGGSSDVVAIAFDDTRGAAIWVETDGGSYQLSGVELLLTGQPTGSPFPLHRSLQEPSDIGLAAAGFGTFALAWDELDLTPGIASPHAFIQLISFAASPPGSACTSGAQCSAFSCVAGLCAGADAGLAPPDGGQSGSGGGSAGTGGGAGGASGGVAGSGGSTGTGGAAGTGGNGGAQGTGGASGDSLRTFVVGCGCDGAGGLLPLLALLAIRAAAARRAARPARAAGSSPSRARRP